jgi:hypothetical protein
MGLTAYPNGISSFGVPIPADSSIPTTLTGKYIYVGNATGQNGSAGNTGEDPSSPINSITNALLKCTANKMDVIVVLPGYTQTVSAASGLNINVAGVTIVGIGSGSLRPEITYDTAATATVAISAANVTVKNISFNANYADVAKAIITSAKNIRIEGCYFTEEATDMNFLTCIATDAVDNSSDGLKIIGNTRLSIDAAALAFISILGNLTDLVITDNYDNQSSAADVGHFIIMAAKVVLGLQCYRNVLNLNGDNNAQTVGVFATGSSTTSTGTMAYNLVNNLDATTELFDTATLDFGHFENRMTGTIAKSGYVLPAIDS